MKKTKKMVALRMNPESKKPSPEMPEGDEKFRLLVMGHREPAEWKTGPHNAPVIGDATFRQRLQIRSCRQHWLARGASQLSNRTEATAAVEEGLGH